MKIRFTQILVPILLLLLLFFPRFNFTVEVEPYGVILLDGTESMQGARNTEVGSEFKIRRMVFGENRSGTDLGKALREAERKFPDADFFILLSDGSSTAGENPLKIAGSMETPVFYIVPDIENPELSLISVYGPSVIEEGDTASYRTYFRLPGRGKLGAIFDGDTVERGVRNEGIEEITFSGKPGQHQIIFYLSTGGSILRKSIRSLRVKEKKRVLLMGQELDWNFKFFRRFFEDEKWTVKYAWNNLDTVKDFSDNDVIYYSGSADEHADKFVSYLKNGGVLLFMDDHPGDLDFLPAVAPRLIRSEEGNYLKPSGLRSNTEKIRSGEENIALLRNYDRGKVVQFTYLDLWKIALQEGVYSNSENFEDICSQILNDVVKEKPSLYYAKTVIEGRPLEFYFENRVPERFEFNDRTYTPRRDSLIIPEISEGKYHFKSTYGDTTISDSVEVLKYRVDDRVGVNYSVLKGIGDLSGGGRWDDDFNPSEFKSEEKEVWINLRHNWFFLGFLFSVLILDWILWLKRK